MMKKLCYAVLLLVFAGGLMMLTACNGANSASWNPQVNLSENSVDGEFSLNASRLNGRRNRTFELTTEELANIQVTSTSESGTITLVISHNGNEDGTEVTVDVTNFDDVIDASTLESGRIRFSLRYDDVRTTSTTISWR
jgi:hypothetical protein